MKAKERSRRRFLKEGAALAGLSLGAITSARGQTTIQRPPTRSLRPLGEPSRFEHAVRQPYEGTGATTTTVLTPLQDLVGSITPSALHYTVSRYPNTAPDIDPREHRLLIHGLVKRPLIFTVEELKRLPSVTRVHFLECNGNATAFRRKRKTVQETHGLTGCSEWTGVPLSVLLNMAGLQDGATWLVAEGADAGKHSSSIPLEKAMDDVMVAYGQNSEAVRPDQGYPLRFLVPGWEGNRNVKWLRRIKVVDQPYMTKTESTSYTSLWPKLDGKARWFFFQFAPRSVIIRPSGGEQLPGKGFYEISGLAWSGGGAITKAEVSTDGGQTWKEARIQGPAHPKAHTRFCFDWTWNGEEAVLVSRCTDERGDVQQTLAEFAKTYGGTEEYWKTMPTSVAHFGVLQPWKVMRDGSVQNAF